MFESINRDGTESVKWNERQKKFGTQEVLPLWVADMEIASPLCVRESLGKRASHRVYGYTIYSERYYRAISGWMKKRFDFDVPKEWIVPCYGVVPSLNFAITAYSQKGEGVLVQTPLYPPFVSAIKHKKRKLLDNVLVYEKGEYRINFEDFERKAKEAKLFLLCSPHNPTGRVWRKEELERMIAICLKYGVKIVSDEIHADVVYTQKHHLLASFKEIQGQCVILTAPSKTFNIAGLNTSYAIIPNHRMRQAFKVVQDKSGLSNGNPFGIEALIAAYQGGEGWLESLKVHLAENIAYVKAFLESNHIPIKVVPTEATFLMWLDCKAMNLTQEALVDFFVNKAKLGLNDGASFGKAGEGFMRLNIGTSKDMLQEAMKRLHYAYKVGN